MGIGELLALGIGLTVAGYIVNKHFLNNDDMGTGRIYNQDINNQYFHTIDPYEDLAEKDPYFQRQYRTHNVTYPDIMYEGVTRQPQPENEFYSRPMPASDDTLLTYAEPSNVVTDNIIYEQGTPDLREDYRLTGVIGAPSVEFDRQYPGGIDSGGDNTIFTTEYSPGINEKVRRDNPIVVAEVVTTPDGQKVQRLKRLAPLEKKVKRRFNKDYDEKGNPLQTVDPVYDTLDYLTDLKLTDEFDEGRPGSQISDDTLKIYEDFLVKGVVREGWEILPPED